MHQPGAKIPSRIDGKSTIKSTISTGLNISTNRKATAVPNVPGAYGIKPTGPSVAADFWILFNNCIAIYRLQACNSNTVKTYYSLRVRNQVVNFQFSLPLFGKEGLGEILLIIISPYFFKNFISGFSITVLILLYKNKVTTQRFQIPPSPLF